jgi:signal transduction histidine kinase
LAEQEAKMLSRIGHFWAQGYQALRLAWNRLIALARTIFTEPFHPLDMTMLQTRPLAEIERARRTALLRCIALSFALGAVFALFIELFITNVPPLTRLAGLLGFGFCMGCLLLSYTRWSALAAPLFALFAFAWVLIFTDSDKTGLSIRSVLVASATAIVILGAGLLLDRPLLWPLTLAMIALSVAEVFLLPIRGAVPAAIVHPHLTAAIYLLLIDGFAAVLTWLHVRTSDTALQTIAAAYSHEYEMKQRKDMFLHIASHELRAPLTPIILTSRLFEMRSRALVGTNSDLLRLTREIVRHALRMNATVDLLLDVTLLDRMQFELAIEPCDVAEVVRDAVDAQKMVTLRSIAVSGIDEPLQAEADPLRIWQLVTNLIANAARYTKPEDAIEVSVWTYRDVLADREMIGLEVRDRGPGIPPDDIPYLFERYYRVAQEGRPKEEGLGLGLFICHAIVTAHQGTIKAASALGEGATFTVALPRFASAAVASPA